MYTALKFYFERKKIITFKACKIIKQHQHNPSSKSNNEHKLKAETTSFYNINLLSTLFGEKLKLVLST